LWQEDASRDGLSRDSGQINLDAGMKRLTIRKHGLLPARRVSDLEAALAERDASIEALCAEHAGTVKVLMERIGELECRLGLNSTNSSKPPSSDGLRMPNAGGSGSMPSRGGAAKRKPGGQPGRVGKTLRPRDEPDRIENHYPVRCGPCGGGLERRRSVSYAAR